MNMEIINSDFEIEMPGDIFLGRGPSATGPVQGWGKADGIYFRCANCSDLMWARQNDYLQCQCRSMHLDIDYLRFGSTFGDDNILVYRKEQ